MTLKLNPGDLGHSDKLQGPLRQIALAFVCLCIGLCLLTPAPSWSEPDIKSKTFSGKDVITLSDVVDAKLTPINSTKALNTSEQSVVRVLVVYRGFGGEPLDQVGMGSGFVVAPGYIITNYHVVEVPPQATSADIYIVPHKATGLTYSHVTLSKVWTEGDMALLSAPDLKIAPLALYLNPQKNQHVVAMGYPGVTDRLLKRGGTELLDPTDPYVTQGYIALFASTNPDGSRIDTLFHTAPINTGNSGGPLLNECGQVVGINTWSAASSMSEGGDVDVPAGQYVATHVSALNNFLSSAGITPKIVSDTCYAKSEDEIVKDDALAKALSAAAEAQKLRLDEQKKAEKDQGLMSQLLLGALIVLSLLVLMLIAMLIRRGPHKEKDAPTAFSEPTTESGDAPVTTTAQDMFKGGLDKTSEAFGALTRPLLHPEPKEKTDKAKDHAPGHKHVPWGWLLLGLGVIVIAVVFILSHGEIMHKLDAFKKPAEAVETSNDVHLLCEIDLAASRNPLNGAAPVDFYFDSKNACINGRTPYEVMPDGSLQRFSLNDNKPAKQQLSKDGLTFTRSDYHLDPEPYKAFSEQKAAFGTLRCATGANSGQKAALQDNLAKVRNLAQSYLTSTPESVTVWRCKATDK